MDVEKISAVTNWPIPKTIKQIRGFLGLASYIKGFVSIGALLTDLLARDAHAWDNLTEDAFNKLKVALRYASELALPNFDELFVIKCDASGSVLGAVLMQLNEPIAYFSKELLWQKFAHVYLWQRC